MAKRGPKGVKIDWVQFDKLCHIQCTLSEIASWFDCSPDTIERAVVREKKMKFAEYFSQKKEKGLISLRRAQWQKATEEKNAVMQIWLGKQYLNQRDRESDPNRNLNFTLAYDTKNMGDNEKS